MVETKSLDKHFRRLDLNLLEKRLATLEAKLYSLGLWWREELNKTEKK